MLRYSSQECRNTKRARKQLLSGSLVHRGIERVYELRMGSVLCIMQHQRSPGVNVVPEKTGVRVSALRRGRLEDQRRH